MLREVAKSKKANNEQVTERAYVEVEKNRKFSAFEVPENYEEILAAMNERDKAIADGTLDPEDPKNALEINPTGRKMKSFQVAPGTLLASHGSMRGVYIALKNGLKKGGKQVTEHYKNATAKKVAM
jgi:hypothetical protein